MSIFETIRHFNAIKGRGEVTQIKYDDAKRTTGEVCRRVYTTPKSFFTERRRFRVVGDRIKAFGTSCKIPEYKKWYIGPVVQEDGNLLYEKKSKKTDLSEVYAVCRTTQDADRLLESVNYLIQHEASVLCNFQTDQ
jgi:hypothetical protein